MSVIPDPGFAGDDGAVSPELAAALDRVAGGAPLEVAVAAVCDTRLLVPVVPLAGDGHGSGADMAAVLLTGRDGRRALLAFSGMASLRAWDAAARPVPVTASRAAQAALAEGAAALVVDVAGPVQVPVEGAALRRVADGQRLLDTPDGWAWTARLHQDGSTGPV